jgi:S-adenosylmethionine-dependent methyltransferase
MCHERHPEPGCSPLPASPYTRDEPHAAFDAKVKAWEDYTHTPLGRLRQELTLRHLLQHLDPSRPNLHVLDAGGGTGSYALPLARLGHRVCLLDFSAQMLAAARQKIERIDRCQTLDPGLIERVDLCQAPVAEVPRLFPPDHFDLVLCHTLLEYVPEPEGVLQALSAVLRPGGLLSLLCANPHADPLRWALARGDPEKARQALHDPVSSADLFGLPRRTFTAEEIGEAMARAGVELVAGYGVRIFADYVPVEKLADAAFWARLLELEAAASALDPYRRIARYNQLVGRKSGTG